MFGYHNITYLFVVLYLKLISTQVHCEKSEYLTENHF